VTHEPGCSRPTPTTDGTGQPRCPACKYLQPRQPQPSPTPQSSYVCREHLDQPVTWRGTGCTLCTKTKRRKATEPSDTNERETYR